MRLKSALMSALWIAITKRPLTGGETFTTIAEMSLIDLRQIKLAPATI